MVHARPPGDPRDRVMLLPDGRRLGYRTYGPSSGPAVLAFHGTPGSRCSWDFLDGPARDTGVRVVAPDRPGIGLSDDMLVRGIVDWPGDIIRLVDDLEIQRFAVVGWSGGAPYALACGALVPDRVRAVAVVSGIGPIDRDGALGGMGRTERSALRLTHRAPWLAAPLYRSLAALVRFQPGLARRIIERSLPPMDRAEFEARGAPEDALAYLSEALRQGPRGVVQDYRLLTYPWGFALRDITSPVHVFHGDDDRSLPLHHAHDLVRRIPGATTHIWPDGGHLAVVEHAIEVLEAVGGSHDPA